MADQEIIHHIGKVLWNIFPTEAATTIVVGWFYESSHATRLDWCDAQRKRIGPIGLGATPREPMRTIETLCLELQRTPPFDRQPFTHMRYELSSEGKVNVDFAYIPEWDSWPGLFMKGVSELTEAEILPPYPLGIYGIDVEELSKRRVRFSKEPYQK